jgi:hypothetical protein
MAFVLLVLVTCGAIGSSAHTHNNGSPKFTANAATPSFSESGDTNSSSKSMPGSGECLVCQLHQNLFSGLLTALPYIAPPVAHGTHAVATDACFHSQTYAPRRGRAPPTSLS